jgi:hypothetical protein
MQPIERIGLAWQNRLVDTLQENPQPCVTTCDVFRENYWKTVTRKVRGSNPLQLTESKMRKLVARNGCQLFS